MERQEIIAKELGVEKVFVEKASGKNTDRPQLKAMLEFLRDGDVLIIESISRLSRSTKDLLEIVEQLQKKNVTFISHKEAIDTSSPSGRFFLTLISALSQLERESLLLRVQEGISAAKAKGTRFGRPQAQRPAEWDSVVKEYKEGRLTAPKAIERLGMGKTTFFKLLKTG